MADENPSTNLTTTSFYLKKPKLAGVWGTSVCSVSEARNYDSQAGNGDCFDPGRKMTVA